MSLTFEFDPIEAAIEDIRQGKVVIVVDDEDRENEGDFLAAAELVTPEMINFMATHGRGLICVPLTEKRCKELDLPAMVAHNTDHMETAFTVSVDLKGHGVTTGISASDRAKTIRALVDEQTRPQDMARPGHIFPLMAKPGGVLRRTGHTEAAIDLARLAGLKPAGVIVEIMNEDGSMARLPQLIEVARKFKLKLISIESLVAYRMKHDSLIIKREDFPLHTQYGEYRLRVYEQITNHHMHLAFTKGQWKAGDIIPTRIQSSISYFDVLGALQLGQHHEMQRLFEKMATLDQGCVLFIQQEQRPEEFLGRIQNIKNQQKAGNFSIPKLKMDQKDFGIGAQILHDVNIQKMKLLTNSPQSKRVGMVGYGLEITTTENY